MNTMTTALPVHVRSVDEDPRVIEIREEHANACRQLDAARSECARLVLEREELNDKSIAVMVRLGKLKPTEVTAACERLDKQIAEASDTVARHESIVEQLTTDVRGVVQETVVELQEWAHEQAREAMGAISTHLAGVDEQITVLRSLHRYGVQPPGTLAIISGFGGKFRDEARRRGFLL